MRLEGIHHITAICADARGNLDFYVRVLGMRFVKKTVNFDAPDVYHLYYGDERGSPGSILTFFEFPGAGPGRAGAGMIHRLRWRVASHDSLAFWSERLGEAGALEEGTGDGPLRFRDPEGLGLELAVVETDDLPLRAEADDVPAEHALLGFDGVRALSPAPDRSSSLLADVLGFQSASSAGPFRLRGGARHAEYAYDPAPPERGLQGAGTVHHIAWACRDEEQEAWRERVVAGGANVTPIIDRQYFHSIYFREPSGVLFEIATLGPGFAVDEDPDHLGEELKLPPQHEPRRAELERNLTPLVNPRVAAPRP